MKCPLVSLVLIMVLLLTGLLLAPPISAGEDNQSPTPIVTAESPPAAALDREGWSWIQFFKTAIPAVIVIAGIITGHHRKAQLAARAVDILMEGGQTSRQATQYLKKPQRRHRAVVEDELREAVVIKPDDRPR